MPAEAVFCVFSDESMVVTEDARSAGVEAIVRAGVAERAVASRNRPTLGPVIMGEAWAAGSRMLWIPTPKPPPTMLRSARA